MKAISLLLAIVSLLVTIGPAAAQPAQAADCQFVLGFKAIHDMIPNIVGDCKTNEYHNPQNGDGLQDTTGVNGKGGLLVWRKSDNWTAYTNGFETWVNGPNGLQKRLNTERLPFEVDPVAPTPGPRNEYVTFDTADQTIKHPRGWIPVSLYGGAINAIAEPNVNALIAYMAPFKMGPGFKVDEFLIEELKYAQGQDKNDLVYYGVQSITVGGLPAARMDFEVKGRSKGFVVAVQKGSNIYFLEYMSLVSQYGKWGPMLEESLKGYVAKNG